MEALGAIILVASTLLYAMREMRRQRRAGIRHDWTKTLVSILGVVVVTGLGFAAMFAASASGNAIAILAAFFLVWGGGMVALIIAVNRWRPPPKID